VAVPAEKPQVAVVAPPAGSGGKSKFRFQVKLGHNWSDYGPGEDKKLKTAFMSGQRTARFNMFINGKKEKYEVNFKKMTQENLVSGGTREIRAPPRLHPPSGPIKDANDKPMEPGPTMCIKVPEGAPGTTIQVPHPKAKGCFFEVKVPDRAKPGQAMLVPVPKVEGKPPAAGGGGAAPAPAPTPAPAAEPEKSKGWSTGAKVAAGVGGVALVGGAAVAGALIAEGEGLEELGDTIADIATDVGETVGDVAADVGDAVGDVAADVGDWLGGAAEDVGDFVMDLF